MSERIDVYWEVIDPLFNKVVLEQYSAAYLASIADVTRPTAILFAASCCVAEVKNGGFLQLFFNPTGVLVPESIEGFKTIGMPELSALVREATSLLGNIYPRDYEERLEALVRASGKDDKEIREIAKASKHPYLAFVEATEDLDFDALNDRFYTLERSENGGFDAAADRYVCDTGLI